MVTHPLDRPVWNALVSGWAPLAEGDGRAWRLEPDHGPFAAARDATPESLAALAALIPAGRTLWTVEAEEMPVPRGTVALRRAETCQMIMETPAPSPPSSLDVVPLGEADAAEMQALAALTKPGPFLGRTHRLGGFIGVKEGGRLVAMAGERMRISTVGRRLAEVSGVCTHPDHRGRGLAGALMRIVAGRMIARGETPFLHAYASNTGAIRLYETLGFRMHGTVTLTEIGLPAR